LSKALLIITSISLAILFMGAALTRLAITCKSTL
jgi:hypothetical protein